MLFSREIYNFVTPYWIKFPQSDNSYIFIFKKNCLEIILNFVSRFIVHNDHQNPELSSLNSFVKQIEDYNPNILVVGGLQMMDNFPMSESKYDLYTNCLNTLSDVFIFILLFSSIFITYLFTHLFIWF